MVGSRSSAAIRATGLRKSFGDWPVLWDLELTVCWGEFMVLLGANGAGKTTLMRILSTQLRPDAGTVSVAGYDRRRAGGVIRRQLGVVGHRNSLYEDLTCKENLLFYGRMFGVKGLREQIQTVLRRVGLEDQVDQRARNLSHGMQKRLSIARAILHRPPILLLDEPEAGLDPDSVSMLKQLLMEWTDAGRAVVMTSHNVELGLTWANRVAVLSMGKIEFQEHKSQLDVPALTRRLTASLEATL